MSTAEQKSLVPTLKAGSTALGIVPTTFDDCYRLAKCAVVAGAVPKGHDGNPEAVCMVIMFGLELGIPPMQSIQGITKINGKFCIYGDLVPGILWARGFKLVEKISGENDDRTATCTIVRPDKTEITRTFSVKDAKKAKLWGKSGPWSEYPDRMLPMRARGFAARDGASDALHGLAIVEEQRDVNLARFDDETRPTNAALDLPDIPDEPAKQLAENIDQTPVPSGEQLAKQPATSDADFLKALDDAYDATKDMDALNEVMLHNEMEVEERGLQQAAGDVYDKHKTRIYDGMI